LRCLACLAGTSCRAACGGYETSDRGRSGFGTQLFDGCGLSRGSRMQDRLPKLTPEPLVGGEGWFVRVEWPDFREDVGAFLSRGEAEAWIEQKSSQWLKTYQRPQKLSGLR
jgi:hypothetical protein